jgi:hypothetical protein
LKNLSQNDKVKQLSTIISEIEEIHLKGKINNDYYTNLKKTNFDTKPGNIHEE